MNRQVFIKIAMFRINKSSIIILVIICATYYYIHGNIKSKKTQTNAGLIQYSEPTSGDVQIASLPSWKNYKDAHEEQKKMTWNWNDKKWSSMKQQKCQDLQLPRTFAKDGSFQYLPERDIYIYSAYLDMRIPGERRVKIMGYSPSLPVPFYCRLYYENGDVYSVLGIPDDLKLTYSKTHYKFPYKPHIYFCEEPLGLKPKFVALTANICAPSATLPIPIQVRHKMNENAVPKKLLVCVKTLYNFTSPYRLIEFIEYQRLLGASHIVFYDFDKISKEVQNVIDYYSKDGFISTRSWKLMLTTDIKYRKGIQINTHGQQTQINDCVYRYMNQYQYILPIDTDEYIVPDLNFNSYLNLIRFLNPHNNDVNGYMFGNTKFCITQNVTNAPVIYLNNFYKRAKPMGFNTRTKCIINPRRVKAMAVHKVRQFVSPFNKTIQVRPLIAKLHHYKESPKQNCVTKDASALKFTENLLKRSNIVCDSLKINRFTALKIRN